MANSFFMCPRIRVTKTDGSKAIIPVDAISGIEENKRSKCVQINTMDGFSYDVANNIVDIDKKIDEAIRMVNGTVPIVIPDTAPFVEYGESVKYENSKAEKFKKKRMLSVGADKPERRVDTLGQGNGSDTPTTPPAFVEGEEKNNENTDNSDESSKEG